MKEKKPEGDVSIKSEVKNCASLMKKCFFFFFFKNPLFFACKMSRKKNNLNGGNLRKQTKKEVNELLELAKLTNDESAFQQKHRYKKFKDKYNVDMVVCLHGLVEGLIKISFFNESVFWCQKILEDIRFCDKQFRLFAFQSLTESFYNLEKYEDAIEYGKKCLEHDSTENLDLLRKLLVLYQMKVALVKLDMKQEAVT